MLTLGILAMIGTVGTAVSDVILMGHASSGNFGMTLFFLVSTVVLTS